MKRLNDFSLLNAGMISGSCLYQYRSKTNLKFIIFISLHSHGCVFTDILGLWDFSASTKNRMNSNKVKRIIFYITYKRINGRNISQFLIYRLSQDKWDRTFDPKQLFFCLKYHYCCYFVYKWHLIAVTLQIICLHINRKK